MIRRHILLAAGLCALAACSHPTNNSAAAAAGGNTTVASAASVAAPAASGAKSGAAATTPAGPVTFQMPVLTQQITAADMPQLRPGLWRGSRTWQGETTSEQTCVRPRQSNPWARGAESSHCPPVYHRTLTGGYFLEASCTSSRSADSVSVRMHMEGDPNSHLTMDMEMRGSGRLAAMHNTRHTEMSYVGPCTPGSTPDE